jgi:hypothetical protein
MDMEYLALIGIFSRKRMMHETLKGWNVDSFSKILRYEPRSKVLAKGGCFGLWYLRMAPMKLFTQDEIGALIEFS